MLRQMQVGATGNLISISLKQGTNAGLDSSCSFGSEQALDSWTDLGRLCIRLTSTLYILWYITPAAFRIRPAASIARSLSIFMLTKLNGTCLNYGARQLPAQHSGAPVRCAGTAAPAAWYTTCMHPLRSRQEATDPF